MNNLLDGQQDLLIELYVNQRMHVVDVAKFLKVGKNTVVRALDKFGIKKGDRFPTEFTSEQHSLMIGSLLGDGNLAIQPNGIHACYRAEHSMKQSEYLRWKFNLLKPWINNAQPTVYVERIQKSSGKSTPSIKFTTVATPLFTKYYHMFYKNNIKIVTQEILNEVDEFALSVWMQDDGSYTHAINGYSGIMRLATCCFNQNENESICQYFKNKWDLNCHIIKMYNKHNDYLAIKFTPTSARQLVEIIRPYVIPSMAYKLDPHLKASYS